jgi:hypothetical protein
MSDFEWAAGDTAATVRVEGQLIMPFYIICDVSGSMHADMDHLHKALADLVADIMSNPVVDDLTMLSIITFESIARTIAPLNPPSTITLPTFIAGGGTNYGAAFREYHRAFETDRARLKAEGKKVYRPCVFFLSDGAPADSDYKQTFDSLLAYDPVTRQGNKAYPYVISFGFRDAPEHVIRNLAYPDFGRAKGRWFLARTSRVDELLESVTSAIGNTVISSGVSASAGMPQIMPPTLPQDQGFQFGEAGDFV